PLRALAFASFLALPSPPAVIPSPPPPPGGPGRRGQTCRGPPRASGPPPIALATASPSVAATPGPAPPRLATEIATATAPSPVPSALPSTSASCIDEAVAPSLPADACRSTASEIDE